MASILSWVQLILLNFLYDIVKSVFLIVTKSRSDTTCQCSATTELKYAILQWANKDPVIFFTCMHERHLRQCHSFYVKKEKIDNFMCLLEF